MKKILIIEDDTDINNLMAECLRKAGYGCTQAFSGTEGLLHAQHEPFDLIILDLMLPGLDGEAVLPQIRKEQTAPVIVVSAKDSLDSKVELLTAGADDYITKPFEVQEFLARVGVQLRRTGGMESRPKTLRHHDLVRMNPPTRPQLMVRSSPSPGRNLRFWSCCSPITIRSFPSRISTTTHGTICTSARIRRSTYTSAISAKS